VQAPLGRWQHPTVPAGLAWLAGALHPEHVVRILDAAARPPEEVEAEVRAFAPEVLGLSLRNVDTTNWADPHVYFAAFPPFARGLRALVGPEVPLVAGGPGFTLFARAVMERVPELDMGIPLEGDVAFPSLLRRLGDPAGVPGVLYRRDGVVRASGPAAPPDLAALRPRLDLLDLDLYRPFQENWTVGVQTKRGCGQACATCTYRLLNPGPIRLRPPEAVADEVEGWVARGFTRFMFSDSLFDQPREHATAVLQALAARRLPATWRAYHGVRDLDPDHLALCVRAGGRELTFSPDAYGAASLAFLGKDATRAEIDRSLDAVARFPELSAGWNFFLGVPGQDPSELLGILRFRRRARRRLGARAGEVRASFVRVEPGTPFHERLVQRGALPAEDPLLPETPEALKALFHRRSGHPLLDRLLALPAVQRRVFLHRRR
jgi:radical SAM superfamily enzyme YgiQ (UPF0313 family)